MEIDHHSAKTRAAELQIFNTVKIPVGLVLKGLFSQILAGTILNVFRGHILQEKQEKSFVATCLHRPPASFSFKPKNH